MAYEPGLIDAALAAVAGDDHVLAAELKAALLQSARRYGDMLEHGRNDATWLLAAQRLKGLAASFGAIQLMTAASEAIEAAPGDPVSLRKVKRAIQKIAE